MARETAQFLALKTLSGGGIVRVAARHNLREIQNELGADSHIDAARMGDNRVLAGPTTAGKVATLADQFMAEAGATVKRKDAVRAIEILFSLPPESHINRDAYFTDALQWARDFFVLPVLSAVIHRDEAAPHMHVLLLPLVNGRMSGSAVMGNRQRLQALQTSFFEQVGVRHGLIRPKAARRLSAATRKKCAELAFTAIVSDADMLLRPAVEQAILDAFGRHPEPLLNALGLSLPTTSKPGKSFVGIMTKPCGPEPRQSKPIGFASKPKPIGFEEQHAKIGNPYVSVGVAPETPPVLPPDATRTDDYIRSSDDAPAEYWDADVGEFRPPPTGRRSQTRLSGDCETTGEAT